MPIPPNPSVANCPEPGPVCPGLRRSSGKFSPSGNPINAKKMPQKRGIPKIGNHSDVNGLRQALSVVSCLFKLKSIFRGEESLGLYSTYMFPQQFLQKSYDITASENIVILLIVICSQATITRSVHIRATTIALFHNL